MSAPFLSQADLYTLFQDTAEDNAPILTDWTDGSTNDTMAGLFSIAGLELERYIVTSFNKCFLELANGPAITGGPDDLQTWAVDHFGSNFARPGAIAAVDTETFSRPFSSVETYGSVAIDAGSIVKTNPDANGNTQRYSTDTLATLTNIGFGFTCSAANATVGAVYSAANGQTFTVKTTISGGTALNAFGSGLPNASGVLTLVSGTGDVTITYSAYTVPTSDISVTVGIEAVVSGAAGDAVAGTISVIESTLLDPTIVATNAGNATGEDAQDDATYRETIRNLIVAFRAAVKAAIEAAALTVPGVVVATAIEIETEVIQWNSNTDMTVGDSFFIPLATLYIADSTGSASPTLVAAVRAAIDPIRAYGVYIAIDAAVAVIIPWTAHLSFNPAGPNFASLSVNPQAILDSMASYIVGLGAGNSFIVANANAAILAEWGPAGTNDLTAFATSIPAGDVTISSNETAIPGTMATD